MTTGQKIKNLRNKKGYTLKQLSDITGLSLSFISDIEHGRSQPSIDNLKKLATGLGVLSSDLIDDASSRSVNNNEAIPVLDDPQVRALARRSLNKNPEKEVLLKKLIKSMLEED